MIGNRAQRLIGRTLVTAAIIGAMVILVLIYLRSGGNGTGASSVALRPNSGHGAGEHGGPGPAGESSGSSGPPSSSPQKVPGNGGSRTSRGSAPGHGASAGPTGTYTGPTVSIPYGLVQVAVAERGGRIVDVKPLQLPTDRPQSAYISERVAPYLREEVLQAQSARIYIVSGATYTSEAYAESLQQALLHAH